MLDAFKAPQPSSQEWISRGPFEVRSERFSGNSQEARQEFLPNENHSRMADDQAGASTIANASGGKKEQVPSPAPLLSAVSEKRPFNRKRCIRRPTYGIHHSPGGNLPKKRFPKSPLPGNDSCMRGELNAAQSPLTMGICAQCEMAGSRPGCFGA